MSRRNKPPVIEKKKPNKFVEFWKTFGCGKWFILIIIFALLLTFKIVREEARYDKLREQGVCTFGTVYYVKDTKQISRMSYEFEASDGYSYRGSFKTRDLREVGTLIRIVYLRTDPKVNAPADHLGIDCSCRWAE